MKAELWSKQEKIHHPQQPQIMNKGLSFLLLWVFFTSHCFARNKNQPEKWYQDVWCKGMQGKVEYRLKDGRRIDCLTDSYAIEVEFAHKWPEAIGQSLDYGMLTNKQAGIVLILKKPADQQYWNRLNKVVRHYQLPIRLWKLGP